MPEARILFIDNFDSFGFNLVDAFESLGAEVAVYRNTLSADAALALAHDLEADLIVFSPGPGTPGEAGCCVGLIRKAAGKFPLLGVCLGHQAMVEAFGGAVGPAGEIVHGKKSPVRHGGHALFAGLPREFDAGRYHSLVATRMPDCLETIAEHEGMVMALAHREMPVYGLQFHPESILTTQGARILGNALALAREAKPCR